MERTQKKYKKKRSKSQSGQVFEGVLKRHPGGFGFVILKKAKDIYIPASKIGSALTNDRVEVSITEKRGDRLYGAIRKILKREWKFVSGPCEWLNEKAVLKSHGLGYDQPVILENPLKIPFKKGDWLKAKITHYPKGRSFFKGDVVNNLGQIGSVPEDDALRVMAQQNMPMEFSKEALAEAAQIPGEVKAKDKKSRRDLRSKFFITIDGVTAKDFDDSIFVESLKNGFRLFVAIADVSFYVKENSALDKEALLKGNSTYLSHQVFPMLPEKLSNQICSLNPQVERLTLVAEMEFDLSGEMIKSNFYEAVIKSQRRLTYAEAQEMLDHLSPFGECVFLEEAAKLASLLIEKQIKEGALDFNLTDTVVKVDSRGVPLDVMRGHRLFAHRLIEQFMLAANKAAALFLKEKGYPLIYRIHDLPDKEKLKQLEIFSSHLGHPLPVHSRKGLLSLLKRFKNQDKEQLINKLVLRAMAQACYSVSNKGHYGLNAPCYTHFTSPIRRYCDLMIHRLLKKSLKGEPVVQRAKELNEKSVFISEREQASVKAERSLLDIKKARFLKNRLGECFEGCISSVTSFGLFIALESYDIEGLVRFRDLPGHWVWDEVHMRAVAHQSHYAIQFGDEVSVRLASVDELSGRIDFELLTHKGHKLPESRGRRWQHSNNTQRYAKRGRVRY